MYDIWYQQIAEISAKANAWCDFAIVCGVIGFVLSAACAVYLFWKWKHEE